MHVSAYKQMAIMIASHVAPRFGGGKVLDVGARRTNPCDLQHRTLFGATWEYWGLDMQDGENVTVRISEGDPWPDLGPFEVVISGQMLEHSRQPWREVQSMARVARPGGVVLLTAPFMWHVHGHPDDYFRFTGNGLAELCRVAGLTVLDSGEIPLPKKRHVDAYCAALKP